MGGSLRWACSLRFIILLFMKCPSDNNYPNKQNRRHHINADGFFLIKTISNLFHNIQFFVSFSQQFVNFKNIFLTDLPASCCYCTFNL